MDSRSSGYRSFYPVGIYFGIWICQRTIARDGNRLGARSIPEYLGDRYQSEALRVSAAILSLMLLFYLAGQLVAGLVMFEMMLGMSKITALVVTTLVLLGYVTLGGAHADILTDSTQGALMVILAIAVIVLFATGTGFNGLDALLDNLGRQDLRLLGWFNPEVPIVASPWSMFAIVVSHIPLGLLPHMGNKNMGLTGRGESQSISHSRISFWTYPARYGTRWPDCARAAGRLINCKRRKCRTSYNVYRAVPNLACGDAGSRRSCGRNVDRRRTRNLDVTGLCE